MSRLEEIWKSVEGYEELYSVSNHGEVYSHISNKKLKKNAHVRNYLSVNLYKDKKMKAHLIHRLVANHFIDNPEDKPEVNHIDGNPKNNEVSNLEWVTPSENVIHAYKTGLAYGMYGENHGRAKLTIDDVKEIRRIKKEGYPVKKIMEIYGISKSTVEGIVSYRTWAKGNWHPRQHTAKR